MFIGQLQIIALLAAATSYLTLRGEIATIAGQTRELDEAAGGLVSMLLWLLFAYGNMNAEVATNGAVVSESDPAIALLGAVLAAIMLGVALLGTAALVDVRSVEAGGRR